MNNNKNNPQNNKNNPQSKQNCPSKNGPDMKNENKQNNK